MIFTFANRSVGLVGQFDTPIEIMRLVISYLGGSVVIVDSQWLIPDVVVFGMNTKLEVIDKMEKHFVKSQFVYEGKINDHMPDERTFGDIIDRVKEELPWGEGY